MKSPATSRMAAGTAKTIQCQNLSRLSPDQHWRRVIHSLCRRLRRTRGGPPKHRAAEWWTRAAACPPL